MHYPVGKAVQCYGVCAFQQLTIIWESSPYVNSFLLKSQGFYVLFKVHPKTDISPVLNRRPEQWDPLPDGLTLL